jgi:hypothetical protein
MTPSGVTVDVLIHASQTYHIPALTYLHTFLTTTGMVDLTVSGKDYWLPNATWEEWMFQLQLSKEWKIIFVSQ